MGGRHILINGHSLLSGRGIAPPDRSRRGGFLGSNERIVCLTMRNGATTNFSIRCGPGNSVTECLGELRGCNIDILIEAASPGVARRLMRRCFSLPRNFIGIVDPITNGVFGRLCRAIGPSKSYGIVRSNDICALLGSFTTTFLVASGFELSSILRCVNINVKVLTITTVTFASKLDRTKTLRVVVFILV